MGQHDESGFRLLDRSWHELIGGQRPRGRRGNPHWSMGCLCVDTEALEKQYTEQKRISAVDFTAVLQWAVTHPAGGRSNYRRPDNYADPLPLLPDHPNRFIRLSRLWRAVPPPNTDAFEVEGIAARLLKQNDFDEEFMQRRTRSVAALIIALRNVRDTRVTYLELEQFSETHGDRSEYDDAIVNIFTRLNTAGRTLTREDITFAWLKINWNNSATEGKGAQESIEELLEDLVRVGLSIEAEDAISAISFIWSSTFGNGQVLKNSDLVRGDRIRPMAGEVSNSWLLFREAIQTVSAIAHARELGFRDQYQSINALSYLWAVYFVGIRWKQNAALNEPEKDSFDNKLRNAIKSRIDRWLICSQWSGLWSRSTDVAVAGLAQRIHQLQVDISAAGSLGLAIEAIERNLDREVTSLVDEARQHIDALSVTRRNQVRSYKTALWVWNRIDSERWFAAKKVLRLETRTKPAIEIDHIFAHHAWEARLAAAELPENMTIEELQGAINSLGNCMLLEKNFNISKSHASLNDFMGQVHPFDEDPDALKSWYGAMQIPRDLRENCDQPLNEMLKSIEQRASVIRADLGRFINGEVFRIDSVGL